MSAVHESPGPTEVDFSVGPNSIEFLKKRYEELLSAIRDVSAIRGEGLVGRLRMEMVEDLEDAKYLYDAIYNKLSGGGKLTIKVSTTKPRERKDFFNDGMYGLSMPKPFTTDFLLTIEPGEGTLGRERHYGEAILVDDILSTMFSQSDPLAYEDARNVLRRGLTINLVPRTAPRPDVPGQ